MPVRLSGGAGLVQYAYVAIRREVGSIAFPGCGCGFTLVVMVGCLISILSVVET